MNEDQMAEGGVGESAGGPLSAAAAAAPTRGSGSDLADFRPLHLLHGVELPVSVELGHARLSMRDVLGLIPGSVVELDRPAGSPVDVVVNGTVLARGEVVVVEEELGVRIVEIVSSDQSLA